jgi:hypothetical protein
MKSCCHVGIRVSVVVELFTLQLYKMSAEGIKKRQIVINFRTKLRIS